MPLLRSLDAVFETRLGFSLITAEGKKAALILQRRKMITLLLSILEASSQLRAEYEEMSRGLRPSKFALLNLRVARLFLADIDGLRKPTNLLVTKNMALVERREHWQLLRARRKSIEAVIASRTKSASSLKKNKVSWMIYLGAL